jgi:hypothetical protein
VERTVPSTASEEVELYLRTYYSLLRSTAEVQIRTLEEAHSGMNSLMHPAAREKHPDMSAFIYCLLRLPACMVDVDLVVLGQSPDQFIRKGFGIVEEWIPVSARARRRRCFFDGEATLACYIASRSDIDDVIPILTAYQIEWNKIHDLFLINDQSLDITDIKQWSDEYPPLKIAEVLHITADDVQPLMEIWDEDFYNHLYHIIKHRKRIRVQLLNGSYSEYRRATNDWWENIERFYPQILEQPIYFVSSNMHSIVNLISGFAHQHQSELINYLEDSGDSLIVEWKGMQAEESYASRENFLYYLLKKYQSTEDDLGFLSKQQQYELEKGITRITSEHSFDLDAQVFALRNIRRESVDPRLQGEELEDLENSDALILNIDYPLGLAAYNILSEISTHIKNWLGIYIKGKAASLNGIVGDITIPSVVHDEQSQNTYLFSNCFKAGDVSPYLMFGTVMDNQKSVSVRGTFLQNAKYMDVFYREGYTDIEMEAGPYLSAIYEMFRPIRHPINEIVNLVGLPFDMGIIHYVSDTPLSRGRNLGAGSLSYYGMDSTYAASIAIIKRIFTMESRRIRGEAHLIN